MQGFIPVENDVFSAESLIPAAWVAVEDVNGDCSILSDYLLQVDFLNTEVYSIHYYIILSACMHCEMIKLMTLYSVIHLWHPSKQ